MIDERIKSRFIEFTGRACFFELTMKLLVNRDGSKVKQTSCSAIKTTMYNKFSEHFTKEDREIIDSAVWIRNKLIHFELSEILKKQNFQSVVVKETIDPKDSNSILKAIKKMEEGKSSPVNENSSLFGLCLEFDWNDKRIQELNDALDKAANIVTGIIKRLNDNGTAKRDNHEKF